MIGASDFDRRADEAQALFEWLVQKYKGEFREEKLRVVPHGFVRKVRCLDVEFEASLSCSESNWCGESEHMDMMLRGRQIELMLLAKAPCEKCSHPRGADGTTIHCRRCADKARDHVRAKREAEKSALAAPVDVVFTAGSEPAVEVK